MSFELYEPADLAELSDEGRKRLNKVFYICNTRLGGTSLPVHLEEPDYMVAFDTAVQLYRTRSTRSVMQTFGFLRLSPGISHYHLHERIDVVSRVSRRNTATLGYATGVIDPSTGSWLPTNGGTLGSVDLVTLHNAAAYAETVKRLTASEYGYSYRETDNMLILHKVPRVEETVLLEVSVLKSLDELLADHWATDWLTKYTLAVSKTILGEKYSFATNLPGPQGGTILKGEQLKQAGVQEMQALEDDLMVWADTSDIALPLLG